MSHMEIDVRVLRDRTVEIVERVRRGESLTVMVNRQPVADISPHARRSQAMSSAELIAIRERHGADLELFRTLEELAGATVGELWARGD